MKAIVIGPMMLGAPAPSDSEKEKLISNIMDTFAEIEKKLKKTKFLNGPKMYIADVFLFNHIVNVDAFLQLDVRSKFSTISAWMDEVLKDEVVANVHEIFQKTLKEMMANMK